MQLLNLFISQHLDTILELRHYKRIATFLRSAGFDDFTQQDIYNTVHSTAQSCNKVFVSYSVGYKNCKKGCACYISELSNKVRSIKATYTCDKKQLILDKRISTVNELYGVTNVSQLDSVKELSRKTKIEKYANPYFNNREKSSVTCMTRFGVDNPSKSSTVKDKTIVTNLSRYGAESPLQNTEIKAKIKNTFIEKYNVDHQMRIPEVKAKIRDTNMQKYGVENFSRIHYSEDTVNFLDNKARFTLESNLHTVHYLSDKYGISLTPIYTKIHEYGLTHLLSSSFQNDVVNTIKSNYSGIVELNNRKLLAPLEIDIYLPEHKLAIECNGTYWHSELNGKDRAYHLAKSNECNNLGIRLIHIWEHVWYSKQDMVVSFLLNKLGLSNKIYARKCYVESVPSSDSSAFISSNHFQQGTNALISLSLKLYNSDETVAMMTFSKSRFNKNYEWELLRFCSLQGNTVIGGASKLFTHFVKNYLPTTVITYSDISIVTGNVYQNLGFKLLHRSPPSYFYTKDFKKIEHRINYQKKKLRVKLLNYDPALTEWQNMVNNNYDRIWDCGNDVWVWWSK